MPVVSGRDLPTVTGFTKWAPRHFRPVDREPGGTIKLDSLLSSEM
jgi:hypothetical protein